MNDTFAVEINEDLTRICDTNPASQKADITALGAKETVPYFFTANNDVVIEKQAEILTKLHNELKITKKKVNVIIPDSISYAQIVEMPKLKEKELFAAIRYQADEFIPMPIEETSLDLEVLWEDQKNKKSLILIVASPKNIVELVQKTIVRAGFSPEALENEMSAVGRLFTEHLKPKSTGSLIVNFGPNNTSLYVIEPSSSLLILTRTFNIGLHLFVKDIVINLNWDDKKAQEALKTIGFAQNASYNIAEITSPLTKELMNEIEKMIILSRDKYQLKIDTIYLMNFASQIAYMKELLQKQFTVQVKPLTLETVLQPNMVTKSFAADIPSFSSVIAGTLR